MNNVFVSIFKTSSNYCIEIYKPKYDNQIKVFEVGSLNEGYSYVVKELLTLNKESYNLHFVYKTNNNSFIRFIGKKKDINLKLKEIYNYDINLIDYKKDEVKSKKKDIYQFLWCINKEEQNKIISFFNTLNIKKKNIVSIDYYYTHTLKNLSDEMIIVVGYSKICAIYFDEVGLKYNLCFEINDYKDLIYQNNDDIYTKYVNEIIFLINLILRLHCNEVINKVNLMIHNSKILKDIRYLVYNIDHDNVVISDD